MRIRTLLAMGAGGALGAGTMYLLDPEHGERRRRASLVQAGRGARRTAANGLRRSLSSTGDVLAAGVAGYRGPTAPQ